MDTVDSTVSINDDDRQLRQQPETSQPSIEISKNNNDWCPSEYRSQNHHHQQQQHHLSTCDNSMMMMYNRTPKGGTTTNNSQISFTMASEDHDHDHRHHPTSRYNINNNNNFDIHLAQIDIETFKSEDIRKIRFDHSMNASNDDDTLRIVDSLTSFTNHHRINNENFGTLSIDSLDISIENENDDDDENNEINSELIQKCSQNDKTKYKIAMIDTSVHSQLQNSPSSSYFETSFHNHDHDGGRRKRIVPKQESATKNPFSNSNDLLLLDNNNLQSPGSLVKMFIQNKIMSNSKDNTGDEKNNNNNNAGNGSSLLGMISGDGYPGDEAIDESTGNSLNTVDSNELPLHVLDLSKKLRSLSLDKQQQAPKYGSTSVSSSSTSFTSTTSSSAATDRNRNRKNSAFQQKQRGSSSTNPFLNIGQSMLNNNKSTRSAATQFPDLFQDKECQASLTESTTTTADIKDAAPVLIYYPNYSLPDLSFLQEIFQNHQDHQQKIFLSPIKHEPVKATSENRPVLRRNNNNNNNDATNSNGGKKKCRPKSYTDYESILNQDLSHIKDWDSLNLLLPDDFKEFIEQNNLLKFRKNLNDNDNNDDDERKNPIPIKAVLPNNHHHQRLLAQKNVKLRTGGGGGGRRNRIGTGCTKRYSLQEYNMANPSPYFYSNNNNNNPILHQEYFNNHYHENNSNNNSSSSFMIRSQTMPNCQMAAASAGFSHGGCYPPPPPRYQNCCHHACCHSGCHSPASIITQSSSQQSSPQNPALNLEQVSSLNSFKKLLSFLSKLDEISTTTTTATATNSHSDLVDNQQPPPVPNRQTSPPPVPLRGQSSSRRPLPQANKMQSQKNRTNKSTMASNNRQQQQSTNMEKPRVILKRPTSLQKNRDNGSGIPIPKRMTSGIPIFKNNTQTSSTRTGSHHHHRTKIEKNNPF